MSFFLSKLLLYNCKFHSIKDEQLDAITSLILLMLTSDDATILMSDDQWSAPGRQCPRKWKFVFGQNEKSRKRPNSPFSAPKTKTNFGRLLVWWLDLTDPDPLRFYDRSTPLLGAQVTVTKGCFSSTFQEHNYWCRTYWAVLDGLKLHFKVIRNYELQSHIYRNYTARQLCSPM